MAAPFPSTPGPWRIAPWSGDEAVVLGKIDGKDAHVTMTCMKQDARLIAAAPDLYEALKDLLSATEEVGYVHYGPLRSKARAALSRARGAA